MLTDLTHITRPHVMHTVHDHILHTTCTHVGSEESVTAVVVEAVVESAVVEGGSRKYDKRKDDESLIEACPRNSLGKPMSHNKAGVIREIAFKVDSALKWDAVKRAMQRLVKEGRLAPQT